MFFKTLIIVVFLAVITEHTASSLIIYSNTQCVSETLDPCTRHPKYPQSILCENINDFKTFIRVLRCGSKKNMQEMFLEESTLEFLPLYIIDFCNFFSLNVKSVVLSKLLEGNELVRLHQLTLDSVRVKLPWDWQPLKVLRRLLKFGLVNMPIMHVDRNLLDNLSSKMESFVMTSTNTSLIAYNAFQRFEDLKYIGIENNNVKVLTREMFPTPAKIVHFNFSKNKISSLPEDLFNDMPHLERIDLRGNLISEIHYRTFGASWNALSALLLEDNPLKCKCKMLWLAKKKSPEDFTGECFSPKHNYGKPLKSLEAKDFSCLDE